MIAEVAAVAAAHPDIVRRFSIGSSYQGRDAAGPPRSATTSTTDEAEPEVLFDGLHHGDEHMGLEMTLRILRWLVDGYGTDERVTRIVDGREIWIVFAVNPDGAACDIRRRPVPPLAQEPPAERRNGDRRHGPQPQLRLSLGRRRPDEHEPARDHAIAGPSAFSAPETRALRDFLASRVVDGRQQIRAAITLPRVRPPRDVAVRLHHGPTSRPT